MVRTLLVVTSTTQRSRPSLLTSVAYKISARINIKPKQPLNQSFADGRMSLECTSCGSCIPPTAGLYKCIQCTNHNVCNSCFHKRHNIGSSSFHTMFKIDPVIKIPAPTSYVIVEQKKKPISFDTDMAVSTDMSTTGSSIFTSRDFLTQFLGYCNHCLKVMVGSKDEFFTCNQCTHDMFNVCKQCMPLMSKHHPSTHTFSKKITNGELAQLASNLTHIDTKCSYCSETDFKGTRFSTSTNNSVCDVCQRCADKTDRQLLKIVPHPFILSTNKYLLAKRAIQIIKKFSQSNDPLTGWTQPYAQVVIEKSVREHIPYQKYLLTIVKTKENKRNRETDLDYKTAKFGLRIMSQMTDPRIVS
ncbi:unnamed protein product [Adineta ricciae]|uniref:ZZ-type domain-containing protein n=1 Tax=Adineta ricciae TaxID=249248 RepID=A0A815X2D9_ADIRI|nr:unnamed protein product [Adineta ricciae]